jgi:hypothetical protein
MATGFHFAIPPSPNIVKDLNSLLALMSVLAQALLTLVRSHLVALLFLSVRHN